ncbi:Lcl C-terminal domain-containing protein [Desulfogranum japonicum]|uniref:Lcl C-terminal domain-containing protein n=1 Tax=Desulfogranum japonicum TaxID=231447 RepID=UPI00040B7499|nr:DUF1566 domain-containing protein [Desulfogranum japonicum]
MISRYIMWSGQTACFDSKGKQVDCKHLGLECETHRISPWPEPRFERLSQDIVRDRATQLIWPRNALLTEYPLNWKESLEWIQEINSQHLFERNDWRLPNRRELRSLIDHSKKKPALPDSHVFHNIALGWYWTSTTAAMNTRYAWYLHTEGGRMFYGNKSEYYWTLPVSGVSDMIPQTGQHACFDSDGQESNCVETGQDGSLQQGVHWPEPRFTSHEHGILDQLTGLIWYPEGDLTGSAVTWDEAIQAVKTHSKTTGQPFRLPTINEIESLIDASQHSPALPAHHMFASLHDGYWTSTTSGYEPDWSYVLYLNKGAVGVGYKPNRDFHVWPVMNLQ